MKTAIVVVPGTNREKDMADAIERASGTRPDFIWHRETELTGYDLIVIPGGFSYGDYLRCGAVAGNSPIMRAVKKEAERGVNVLGVCNGFQVLTETGLLPGALMRNAGLRFICKYTHLRTERNAAPFSQKLKPGEVIKVAIANNEGNYFADEDTLDRLEDEGRVAFRYCDAAGIVNEAGNVLGMMPHPENATEELIGGMGGFGMFESMNEALN